jgi:hypothetical protein
MIPSPRRVKMDRGAQWAEFFIVDKLYENMQKAQEVMDREERER